MKKSPGGADGLANGAGGVMVEGALIEIRTLPWTSGTSTSSARSPRPTSRGPSAGRTAPSGSVADILVASETGEVRVSLWDDLADLVKVGDLKEGDTLRVRGYVKEGQKGLEVSIGRGGGIVKDDCHRDRPEGPDGQDLRHQGRRRQHEHPRHDPLHQEPRTFSRKDGSTGSLASLMIGDETGKVRVTVWDTKIKDLDPLPARRDHRDPARLHPRGLQRRRRGQRGQPGHHPEIGDAGSIRGARDENRRRHAGQLVQRQGHGHRHRQHPRVHHQGRQSGKALRRLALDERAGCGSSSGANTPTLPKALSVGDEILVTDAQAKLGMKGDVEM